MKCIGRLLPVYSTMARVGYLFQVSWVKKGGAMSPAQPLAPVSLTFNIFLRVNLVVKNAFSPKFPLLQHLSQDWAALSTGNRFLFSALTPLERPRPPLSHVEPAAVRRVVVVVALIRNRLDLLRRAATVAAPLFLDPVVREGGGPVVHFVRFKMQFGCFTDYSSQSVMSSPVWMDAFGSWF